MSKYLTREYTNYDEFHAVWGAWITLGHAPSRACVEAQSVKQDWMVEMQVLAAV